MSLFPNCPAQWTTFRKNLVSLVSLLPPIVQFGRERTRDVPVDSNATIPVLAGTDFDSVAVVRPSGILDLSCLPRTTCMPDTAAAVSSRESNPASAIGD